MGSTGCFQVLLRRLTYFLRHHIPKFLDIARTSGFLVLIPHQIIQQFEYKDSASILDLTEFVLYWWVPLVDFQVLLRRLTYFLRHHIPKFLDIARTSGFLVLIPHQIIQQFEYKDSASILDLTEFVLYWWVPLVDFQVLLRRLTYFLRHHIPKLHDIARASGFLVLFPYQIIQRFEYKDCARTLDLTERIVHWWVPLVEFHVLLRRLTHFLPYHIPSVLDITRASGFLVLPPKQFTNVPHTSTTHIQSRTCPIA